MTFRAKPVVKRSHRPSWESQDRRNFYLNLGFGLVVVAAILILLIAAGLSWYNDHLASVGSVDGQGISKDEFADRYAIETLAARGGRAADPQPERRRPADATRRPSSSSRSSTSSAASCPR